MQQELRLRLVLENPPPGIDFGIQKGKARDYDTIETKRSKGKKLTLAFVLPVGTKDGAPNFTGPISQGPPAGRFVYVDIGTYAGQTNTEHGARMKVPLGAITWDMIEKVVGDPEAILEARLPGGATATTRPIDGWTVVRL